MANSGNGFNTSTHKFTLSESEKQNLSKTMVNYLTRPIRFFYQLEELFSDQSQADGSLAADQSQTTVNLDDGSDDNEDAKELEGYSVPVDSDEADSDTIGRNSPKVELDGNPWNNKRKRVTSSPSKKPTKGKANSKDKVSSDDIAASIKKLEDSLATIVTMQPMPSTDPYANLWKQINALPITAKDKNESTSNQARSRHLSNLP